MVKFLLYLFESGLCLSILLLVYLFFFRKETYFKFNRIYLISAMILSLFIPSIHLNFNVSDTQKFEYPFKKIGKFRNYYEQLIAITDPEFAISQGNRTNMEFEGYENNFLSKSNDPLNVKNNTPRTNNTHQGFIEPLTPKFNILTILFMLYILGVVIFFTRILLLFKWIYKTIRKNPVKFQNKIKLIELKENMPPFSFMNYIFLNKDIISNKKTPQIIVHEEAHIKQKHSFDLLLAHSLTIFQWFNPVAWLLQNAIKTNHEYLADSQVVSNGYDLLDYQELLLNQFISIPSVQVVNNFNLISIKKRIAMMNKMKSGFFAKFKVLLVIPAALFTFLLFANLTLNNSGNILKNFNLLDSYNELQAVKGLWKNISPESYGKMVLLENMKFSVLEKDNSIKEYPLKLEDNQLILVLPGNEKTILKYELINKQLKVWWSKVDFSVYSKSEFTNSLDDYLSNYNVSIDLPVIKNYQLVERTDLCIDILMVDDKIFINKNQTNYSNLKEAILSEKSKMNQLNSNLISIRLYADKNLSMKYIHKLNQVLREINLLKIIHMGKIMEHDISKLQSNFISMPKMLPPLSAKELELSDLNKESITFIEIDTRIPGITPELLKPKFEEILAESKKYIAGLYYNEKTTFDNYLGYHDMARTVVYEFRNKYANKVFKQDYEYLSSVQQREVRKIYPIIISEKFFKSI